MFAKSTFTRLLVLLAALAVCQLAGSAQAKKPDTPGGGGGGGGGDGDGGGYTVLTLDPELGDAARSIAVWDVNEHNRAVGYAEPESVAEEIPIYWMVSGTEVSTIHLGNWGTAYGVNNDDVIAGERRTMDGGRLAVYWPNPLAASEDLPIPAGYVGSSARKINDHGFVVGSVSELVSGQDSNGNPIEWQVGHAAAWRIVEGQTVPSGPLLLGDLVPGEEGHALDVSPAEEIADGVFAVRVCGMGRDPDDYRAVTWELIGYVDEQGAVQLEVIDGPTDIGTPAGKSFGDAINVRGDVCGRLGFRKLFGQSVEQLLPPSGIQDPRFAIIGGMNDQAEIVGEYWYGMGESAPVLWQPDGTPGDLNKHAKGTEWAAFWSPQAINNAGTIVGSGSRYASGRKNSPRVNGAFMLIPGS